MLVFIVPACLTLCFSYPSEPRASVLSLSPSVFLLVYLLSGRSVFTCQHLFRCMFIFVCMFLCVNGRDTGCIVIAPQPTRKSCLLCKQGQKSRQKNPGTVIKPKRMFDLPFGFLKQLCSALNTTEEDLFYMRNATFVVIYAMLG